MEAQRHVVDASGGIQNTQLQQQQQQEQKYIRSMSRRSGEDSSGSEPEILRPVPRRPFALNVSNPTPPTDEDSERAPSPARGISASDLRFLDAHQNTPPRDGATPLSQTTSFQNLTSSTLFGIYSPYTKDPFSSRDQDPDDDAAAADDDSGSGSGSSSTPAPRPALDSSQMATTTYERRSSAVGLALRAALLFVLGVGYGMLVTRLPREASRRRLGGLAHQQQQSDDFELGDGNGHDGAEGVGQGAADAASDWRYLVFWGVAGVVLGSLLPWFDRVWEETVNGRRHRIAGAKNKKGTASPAATTMPRTPSSPAATEPAAAAAAAPDTDWALVVRSIGAFVGIVFAIRRLPWASTMQMSLTLALANPFLWYLIDRSKPGFLLSAAVGLAGWSAVMLGLNPDLMPAPAGGVFSPPPAPQSSAAGSLLSPSSSSLPPSHASTTGNASRTQHEAGATSSALPAGVLGGFASQETIGTGIWVLSVLFCSCVCFGNIGRRLALNASAAGRGRWGGVR